MFFLVKEGDRVSLRQVDIEALQREIAEVRESQQNLSARIMDLLERVSAANAAIAKLKITFETRMIMAENALEINCVPELVKKIGLLERQVEYLMHEAERRSERQ